MGLTFFTSDLADDFASVKRRLEHIEQQIPEGLRGKIHRASDLLREVEDAVTDGPAGARGAA